MIFPRLVTNPVDSQAPNKTTLRQNACVRNNAVGFNLALPITTDATGFQSDSVYCVGFDRFTIYVSDDSAVSRLSVYWVPNDPAGADPADPILIGTTTARNAKNAFTYNPATMGVLLIGAFKFISVGASTVVAQFGPMILES